MKNKRPAHDHLVTVGIYFPRIMKESKARRLKRRYGLLSVALAFLGSCAISFGFGTALYWVGFLLYLAAALAGLVWIAIFCSLF